MIKKVIIGLAVLNILFFIWTMFAGNNTYTQPPLYEEGVAGITLLPRNNKSSYQSSATSTPSSCYAFGPFDNEKSAQIIANRINGFGLWTDIQNQETMQTLNFLVYLQPFSSRDEAVKVVKEIRKHEVKNTKILDSGPYKNAIALGSFDDLNKARRHAEYVRFLGYDARHTTQQKRKVVYWVNFDEPFGTNVPVMRWAKEIDNKSSPQKIPKSCINK